MKRKLIEVALPLDAINAASHVEKQPFTRRHPRSLHIWWARRPLAACRAVLFAQLVDDPSAHPEQFPTEEDQDRERQRLFRIIEELVKWENTTNETVLNAARQEILKSTGGNPPPILDPFAGGGSIPLEAQRLGLEAHASDLNPVAVLINKALIEIPPKWADLPPVHPDAEQRTHWRGSEGLAEDVRLYGKWIRDEAERRIGHLYPKAKLEDGAEASVIAWIWARTVTCPNPACGATMPLASSFWLSKRKGKEAWINPIVDHEAKTVRFDIGHGPQGPPDPPKVGRGAKFRCLVCGETAEDGHVKTEGRAGRMSAQLMAAVASSDIGKRYLGPETVSIPATDAVASVDMAMPHNARWFSPPMFGLTQYADLFTTRQSTALRSLVSLVREVQQLVQKDAASAHLTVPAPYARDVATYLALGVSRWTDISNAISTWNSSNESIRALFARQAIPMTFDFAEANPFEGGPSWYSIFSRSLDFLGAMSMNPGVAEMRDATIVAKRSVIATDPPYYDNIGYSDLSDFFYLWLRDAIGVEYPDLFKTLVTPKTDELIADPFRHSGSRDDAARSFESGFVAAFRAFRQSQDGSAPMTFFYAFKQAESDTEVGLGSTGWSTMLEGLLQAGWSVTATWPMRTERAARSVSLGTNALASSVVLACRPRAESAGITDRQGFVRALHERLPAALHELQTANIAPVDLRQAAIGPGMAVFSSYSRVVEPDGEAMRVRTALGLINQVLDQVLGEQEAEFDPETRWAIQWFSQFFDTDGPYGTAEQLAVAMNISVDGMRRSGIVSSGGGKVRLLGRDEYPDEWDPTTDDRTPVWEACQHLVKRLESDGEAAAGRLLAELGGLGESAQLLAYRLYTVCERTRPGLAGPYNALVASWPQIQNHARTLDHGSPGTAPSQGELM